MFLLSIKLDMFAWNLQIWPLAIADFVQPKTLLLFDIMGFFFVGIMFPLLTFRWISLLKCFRFFKMKVQKALDLSHCENHSNFSNSLWSIFSTFFFIITSNFLQQKHMAKKNHVAAPKICTNKKLQSKICERKINRSLKRRMEFGSIEVQGLSVH